MQPDPAWRQILCWGAVIAFFAMPIFVFALQIVAGELKSFHFEENLKQFAWSRDYFRLVAMLVFGLAGLNTVDRWHNGKAGKKE